MTSKTFSFQEQLSVSDKGMVDIQAYLNSLNASLKVINVENHPVFQQKDIDLVWTYLDKNEPQLKTIEVKVDTYTNGLNFYIETVSNLERHHVGCFLYTEAEQVFYYFYHTGILYSMPTQKVREWFLKNIHRFHRKQVENKVYNHRDNSPHYTSEGYTVPIELMLKEVPGIKKIYIKN